MRKLLLFCFVAFFSSCTQTIEDRICNEFKKYVNLNFDDPGDFKEIVSIELKDTFNNASLYEIVSFSYKLDSLNEVGYTLGTDFIVDLVDEMKPYEKRYRNLSSYKREKLLEMVGEYINLEDKTRSTTYKNNKRLIDSAFCQLDTFDVKKYNVRIRVQKNDEQKILDYYCITEDGVFRFYDKKPTLTEMTPKCESFIKKIYEYNQQTEEYQSIITQRVNKRQEIIDYVKSLGILINL